MVDFSEQVSRVRTFLNSEKGRWVAVGAGALILLLAGVKICLYAAYGSTPTAKIVPTKVLYVCTDAGCGKTGEMLVAEGNWPRECPACKKKTAVLGFRCVQHDCGQILVMKKDLVKCTKCGHTWDFREQDPAHPEQPTR